LRQCELVLFHPLGLAPLDLHPTQTALGGGKGWSFGLNRDRGLKTRASTLGAGTRRSGTRASAGLQQGRGEGVEVEGKDEDEGT